MDRLSAQEVAELPAAAAILARARHENFTVASRLLLGPQRRHLMALYGFARLADLIGDELAGNRLELLDWLESELDRAFSGEPRHPLTRELARTVRGLSLPREPFRCLIEANRRDQVVHRYETFEELVDYCTLSANPIGHLVLCIFGVATRQRITSSDAICTALQLTEHCQDVAEDLARDRVYLPGDDLRRFGCSENDLRAREASPRVRALIAFEVDRARALLDQGRCLLQSLRGRPLLAVAGFVAGGYAALDAIERERFDVLARTPRPRRAGQARRFLEVLARALLSPPTREAARALG